MVQFRIVVAKYKEDVEWCKSYNCIVYDKGGEGPITLPNIGREAHTYLYHIVENYDNLDDYTIFLQGNPFDHCKNLYSKIDCISEAITIPDYIDLCDNIFNATSKICHFDRTLAISDMYTLLFGDIPERQITFGAGAQFCVSKQAILRIPKHVWIYLLENVDKNRGAWVLERLWKEIFLSGLGDVPHIVLQL